MPNDLKQRVGALEKDMAEVRADVAALKEQSAKKPQDVDGKIQYLLGIAVDEAVDNARHRTNRAANKDD